MMITLINRSKANPTPRFYVRIDCPGKPFGTVVRPPLKPGEVRTVYEYHPPCTAFTISVNDEFGTPCAKVSGKCPR
jgi:hypothetical protein